jgi:hypothetical protein
MAQKSRKRPDTDAAQQLEASAPSSVSTNEGGRRIVVVLGSGRSGTSLCAKILSELGVRMDATLHRPNEMNPEGYFEDREIVEINRRLLEKLSPIPSLPPRSDLPRSALQQDLNRLRDYLQERTSAAPETWGFKDPRVSLVLPYYRRIFDELGIVPTYVFCARDAASTVQSLMAAGSSSRDMAEMVYFTRAFLALRDCSANCHVLHYERLLADPAAQIESLWRYIAAPGETFPLDQDAARRLVNPALNRSSLRAQPLASPLATRIDSLIGEMDGTNFDRDHVVGELKKLDDIHRSYQIWLDRFSETLDETRKSNAVTASRKDNEKAARQIQSLTKSLEDRKSAETQLRQQLNAQKVLEQKLLDAHRDEIDKRDEQIATLVQEAERLRHRLAEVREEAAKKIAGAEAKEASLRASVDGIIQESGRLRSENSRLTNDRNAAVTKARSHLGELHELNKALEQLQRQMAKQKAESDNLIAAAKKSAAATVDSTAVKNEVAAAKLAVVAAQQELAAVNRRLEEQQVEANKLMAMLQKQAGETQRIVGSVRYRAGTLLADAMARPGLKTLALPWRLVRLKGAREVEPTVEPRRAKGRSDKGAL